MSIRKDLSQATALLATVSDIIAKVNKELTGGDDILPTVVKKRGPYKKRRVMTSFYRTPQAVTDRLMAMAVGEMCFVSDTEYLGRHFLQAGASVGYKARPRRSYSVSTVRGGWDVTRKA